MHKLLAEIKQGEGQEVEFKRSFQKEVIASVVAFANAKGGKVFIGVSDSGEVIGVPLQKESLQEWTNQIKLATSPSVIPDIYVEKIDTKTIVIIEVKEYPLKPISYKNRYYKRIKNSNHIMSLDEISNEHLKTINSSWDYYVDDRHDFSDISQENISNLLEKIETYQGKNFTDDPLTILRKYELIKNDKITFAAYLLFTSNNSALTAFQLGRFKSPVDIIDNIDLNVDIVSQIDMAIEFIKKHLMTEFVISGKPQRSIKYDYPLEAIREIVINMVVHRDYRDSGNSIVKIFDNRIEFFNPGKLYDDITIEKLNTGEYASRTRNRAIARIFKEAGIIERYGSGIARIKNECKLHGIAEPVFEEFVHGFKVVIFKEKVKRKDVGVNVGANVGANELYDFIKSNQAVNISMLVEKFDAVTKRTIERWIKQLKDEGKIEFVGASKTGGYVVK